MINPAVEAALNEQIGHELDSAYVYLAISADFAAGNLLGFAHWMRVQAQEELGHALRIYDFVIERNGRVSLPALAQPRAGFGSALDAFEAALAHEQEISALINRLYALAIQERDVATQVFLNWFVTEQVEEEAAAGQVVETLRLIGDDKPALVMLDRELGRRSAD